MGCNCGSKGLVVDEVRKVVFPDGTWTLVGGEDEARGEVSAHGGGTWSVLRGADAANARSEFASMLMEQRNK